MGLTLGVDKKLLNAIMLLARLKRMNLNRPKGVKMNGQNKKLEEVIRDLVDNYIEEVDIRLGKEGCDGFVNRFEKLAKIVVSGRETVDETQVSELSNMCELVFDWIKFVGNDCIENLLEFALTLEGSCRNVKKVFTTCNNGQWSERHYLECFARDGISQYLNLENLGKSKKWNRKDSNCA